MVVVSDGLTVTIYRLKTVILWVVYPEGINEVFGPALLSFSGFLLDWCRFCAGYPVSYSFVSIGFVLEFPFTSSLILVCWCITILVITVFWVVTPVVGVKLACLG